MKLSKYIIFSIGVLSMISCEDDFLDKQPMGNLSETILSEDEQSIDLLVNRLYGTLSWREWYIGQGYFGIHEACSGDVKAGGDASFTQFREFTYSAGHGWLSAYWNRMYQCIHFCNVVIGRTPTLADKELAVSSEAQAKFFRAYYNFEITNAFGEAPLRDHVPGSEEYNIPKSTREEFNALIISDLEYAINHLPTKTGWGTDGNGRITKGTAQGLLSKVYLFKQDYTKAKQYAEAVISSGEYHLQANYRDIFSPDNLYGVENMMPGHFKHNSTVWVGRWYNPYLQHQGSAGSFGAALFYPSNELAASYESGDPRFTATLFTASDVIEGYGADGHVALPSGVNYLNKKVIWPKSYWNNGTFEFQNINPMFMRYADILLVYAEASNELGQGAAAVEKLEQIRFRARGGKSFAQSVIDGDNSGQGVLPEITVKDKASLRELIWNERHLELALEGQRWFDMVRYNSIVPGYTEQAIDAVTPQNSFKFAQHHYFPLPTANVTSSNNILVQNSEW